MDDLDRLFQHLVSVLMAEDPSRLSSPIQISELYQTILPYRTYKKQLNFDTNQDYEMALLRLLAGEKEYATVEPAEVQQQLRLEVEAVDPNPSAFHEFAAARVTLNNVAAHSFEHSQEVFAPPTQETPEQEEPVAQEWSKYAPPEDETPTPPEDAAPSETQLEDTEEDEEELDPPEDQPRTPVFEAVEPAPQEPEPVPLTLYQSPPPVGIQSIDESQCRHCAETLPKDRKVRFCPFCGEPIGPTACGECGSKMEENWRFCPDCGAAAASI